MEDDACNRQQGRDAPLPAYVSIAFPTVVRGVQLCNGRVAATVPTTLLASVCLFQGGAMREAAFTVIESPKCGVRLGCAVTRPSVRNRAEIGGSPWLSDWRGLYLREEFLSWF